jgi:hypothetical protein
MGYRINSVQSLDDESSCSSCAPTLFRRLALRTDLLANPESLPNQSPSGRETCERVICVFPSALSKELASKPEPGGNLPPPAVSKAFARPLDAAAI